MKWLQVIEVDVYSFKSRHERRVLMSQMKLKKNEAIIHNGLLIVTRERIEKNERD